MKFHRVAALLMQQLLTLSLQLASHGSDFSAPLQATYGGFTFTAARQPLRSARSGDLSVRLFSFGISAVTPGSLSTLTAATAASQRRLEWRWKLREERRHMNNHPDAAGWCCSPWAFQQLLC